MLQSVQNRAVRLLMGASRYDHITPFFRQLHWLTVKKRILFKIDTLIFKCLNGHAPSYLMDRCAANPSTHSFYLRSNYTNLVFIPPTSLKAGSRYFLVFGPTVWNALPSTLRQMGMGLVEFKRKLKTHLFCQTWVDCLFFFFSIIVIIYSYSALLKK